MGSMNARDPVKLLLVFVAVLAVVATLGAVVAEVAPGPGRRSVEPSGSHALVAPRASGRSRPAPARRPDGDDLDIMSYVNLYAIAGAVTCLGVLACWGRWQTHHRCPGCGYCPAWCRCGEASQRHGH